MNQSTVTSTFLLYFFPLPNTTREIVIVSKRECHQIAMYFAKGATWLYNKFQNKAPTQYLETQSYACLFQSIFHCIHWGFVVVQLLVMADSLLMMWPKHLSFRFSISPSNAHLSCFLVGLTGLILQSMGLSKDFLNTIIQRHVILYMTIGYFTVSVCALHSP